MEARGYDPSATRTRYRELTWHCRDFFALLMMIIYLGGFFYLLMTGFTLPL
jgi:energy-coupling factor transporter transmembrane protein EcfT